MDKAILSCALTDVLTNPKQHGVPVTPAQMAAEALVACARNAGRAVASAAEARAMLGLGSH